jgi:hypothetical protein
MTDMFYGDPVMDVDFGTPEPDDDLGKEQLMEKIRFSWRTEDQEILAKIEAAGEDLFAELFADTIAEVDKFFESLYTPRYRNNAPVVDLQGRQMWEVDEKGHPKEDWSLLCGQDFEQCLMNLQRIKMTIAPEINRLKSRALYGKMASEDARDDSWGKVVVGTVGDHKARTNRASRVDRYHAFYVYTLWATGDTFEKEIVQFMRRLEKIRDWQIWDREK